MKAESCRRGGAFLSKLTLPHPHFQVSHPKPLPEVSSNSISATAREHGHSNKEHSGPFLLHRAVGGFLIQENSHGGARKQITSDQVADATVADSVGPAALSAYARKAGKTGLSDRPLTRSTPASPLPSRTTLTKPE